MRIITFTHDRPYKDDNVFVRVRLTSARTPTVIRAMIDTGAGITLLNRQWLNHLKINVRSGAPVPLTMADKTVHTGYIHPVDVEFMGTPMTIQAAFVPTADTLDLLGMNGFFDQILAGFDHARKTFYARF